MRTEKEINDMIQEDWVKWYETIYDGELPENLIDIFKIALFKAPPMAYNKLHTKKLKEICAKKPYDLTRTEVGIVINTIMQGSFDNYYQNIDEALEKHAILESIQLKYNKEVKEIENNLVSKRNSLLRMSNIHPRDASERLIYNKIK